MSTFLLPDLGEGLPDAEISEWHVKEGDTVKTDQPLVSMETAKAVVEVPAPQDGIIAKLHGQPGDIIKTGAPLVEFSSAENSSAKSSDSGTVVGNIESSGTSIAKAAIAGAVASSSVASGKIKATPAVRQLAKQLGVDLNQISGSGPKGTIRKVDVEQAANNPASNDSNADESLELLRGPRRMMAINMVKSHREVVPVTIFEDADIHAWSENTDITARIIQAVCHACQQEPALNAWFDGEKMGRKLHSEINLGLAIDSKGELYVPVINNAGQLDPKALREQVNHLKSGVAERSLAPDAFTGATITLSNFGNFAGRYASPIIVPPMVAIIAVGKLRDEVVASEGKAQTHRIMPLSLSFDHRAVTGGEATRFFGALVEALQQA